MADIKDQLIKDSYNYVLQSDLSTGVVYRIGGSIPINPIFQSGLTINDSFTYSNGTEQNGYALLTDGTGYAYWGPVSGASPSSGVTSISVGDGLSANSSTGAVTIVFTGSTGLSGGGTTNYLPKWTGSTSLGDSIIYDDGTNVGIGTSSPSAKLDINVSTGGTIGVRISGDSSSDMLRVTQTGSGNAIIVEDSSNPDSTPFVVAADGRVGIGVTAPLSSYKLHVRNGTATSSAAATGTVATFEGSGATYVTVLSPDASNAGITFGSGSDRLGAFVAWNHNNNQFSFNTDKTGGFITFSTDDQFERMRITSAGNVGIGTTSPSAKLDINASTGGTIGVRISGDSSSDMLRITQTGPGNAILVEDSSNPDSTPFVVTSGGTVGIGTTSPSYFIEAISTGGVDAVMMFDGGTAANANLIARADTTIKVPVIVMSDRNNAYGINTSFFIGLDRASGASWSTFYSSRNDAIYVNNYTNKGHHFVTANSGGAKSVRMSILGSGNVGIGTSSPSSTLHVSGNTLLQGSLTATTISATTYDNLPPIYQLTGGTYSSGTIDFKNTTGGTSFSVTGLSKYFITGSTPSGTINDGDRWFDTNSGIELVWITDVDGSQWIQPTQGGGGGVSGDYLPLSGGTVTGSTNFTAGLTSNTISATTYQNLPVSGLTGSSGISVTGNSNGNFTISYTGSTGASGDFLPLSGGTVTGNTTFSAGVVLNALNISEEINNIVADSSGNLYTYTDGVTISAGSDPEVNSGMFKTNRTVDIGGTLYRVYNIKGNVSIPGGGNNFVNYIGVVAGSTNYTLSTTKSLVVAQDPTFFRVQTPLTTYSLVYDETLLFAAPVDLMTINYDNTLGNPDEYYIFTIAANTNNFSCDLQVDYEFLVLDTDVITFTN